MTSSARHVSSEAGASPAMTRTAGSKRAVHDKDDDDDSSNDDSNTDDKYGSSSSHRDMRVYSSPAASSSSSSMTSRGTYGGSRSYSSSNSYDDDGTGGGASSDDDNDDDGGPSLQRMLVSVEYVRRRWWAQAASLTLLAPLDRVRYVMLTRRELQRMGVLSSELRGSLSCARYLTALEGWRSLWRGNVIQVVAVLPTLLAQLFIALPTESMLLLYLCPVHTQHGHVLASYVASLGGAVAGSMISYPLDYARFRLAVDLRPHRGRPYSLRHSLDFFAQRVFTESPHLLYTGFALYVLGSVVYRCVHTTLVLLLEPYMPPVPDDDVADDDDVRDNAAVRTGDGDNDGRAARAHDMVAVWRPILVQTVCGFAVAGTATLCLHPLDVVRHRMMLAVTRRCLRYPSALHCFATVLVKEGVRGLYTGWTVTLTRLVAATGLNLYMQR